MKVLKWGMGPDFTMEAVTLQKVSFIGGWQFQKLV